MITDNGKEIVSKYMLGQAPNFATHISLGCGVMPIAATVAGTIANMEFEMIRLPISSRGYVNDEGVSKLSLAAEMPTIDSYAITEVGLWSSGFNANAQGSDSRMLHTFTRAERWMLHNSTSIGEIPFHSVIASTGADMDLGLGDVLSTTANTPSMADATRQARHEGTRYLNDAILLRGDSSKISLASGHYAPDSGYSNKHIHVDNAYIDLSQNTPNDEIRIAFSVLSQESSNDTPPVVTRIYMDFLQSEGDPTTGYARLEANIAQSALVGNRYYVLKVKLGDLVLSPDFAWSKVRTVRIFASCADGSNNPVNTHYVALDAIRFENLSTPNPLYAMTGYSIVDDGSLHKPIYKIANTSNYIEFRFALGVA